VSRTDPVIARTRRRLTLTTLGLIALLVVLLGATTALVGLRVLDDEVDRALDATAQAALHRFQDEPAGSGDGEGDGGEEVAPSTADTFVLYLDRAGKVIANPSRVPLAGLPDEAAVASAAADGSDVREITADGVPVRLETLAVGWPNTVTGFVQAGFVLTLHEQQSARLVLVVAIVGLIGLLGAGIVAVLVTGRALVPIRRTVEGQRRFVADASHELRTPATLIRSAGEVLERESLVAPDGRPFVDDIIAEADRLSRLVGDLLTLASTDAGMVSVDRGPLDLAEVTADTVRRATGLARERHVQLVSEASGATLIHGDRDRVVQLLLILIDNASAHSPVGGTVRVLVQGAARQVRLSVLDEGPGIPEAERDRVFEPFHRIPGERRTDGTGLGLAIARRLAEGHAASIEIDDAPDGGARFTVIFAAE
jgi:two-component system sensor histidine kinase CiaH